MRVRTQVCILDGDVRELLKNWNFLVPLKQNHIRNVGIAGLWFNRPSLLSRFLSRHSWFTSLDMIKAGWWSSDYSLLFHYWLQPWCTVYSTGRSMMYFDDKTGVEGKKKQVLLASQVLRLSAATRFSTLTSVTVTLILPYTRLHTGWGGREREWKMRKSTTFIPLLFSWAQNNIKMQAVLVFCFEIDVPRTASNQANWTAWLPEAYPDTFGKK